MNINIIIFLEKLNWKLYTYIYIYMKYSITFRKACQQNSSKLMNLFKQPTGDGISNAVSKDESVKSNKAFKNINDDAMIKGN